MNYKYKNTGIYLLSKKINYKKGKKISGDKVVYQCKTEIGIGETGNNILVKNIIRLANPKRIAEIYAQFEIGCTYEHAKGQSEKGLVAMCVWDSYVIARATIFESLNNTLLEGTITPTIPYYEVYKDLRKSPKGEAKSRIELYK